MPDRQDGRDDPTRHDEVDPAVWAYIFPENTHASTPVPVIPDPTSPAPGPGAATTTPSPFETDSGKKHALILERLLKGAGDLGGDLSKLPLDSIGGLDTIQVDQVGAADQQAEGPPDSSMLDPNKGVPASYPSLIDLHFRTAAVPSLDIPPVIVERVYRDPDWTQRTVDRPDTVLTMLSIPRRTVKGELVSEILASLCHPRDVQRPVVPQEPIVVGQALVAHEDEAMDVESVGEPTPDLSPSVSSSSSSSPSSPSPSTGSSSAGPPSPEIGRATIGLGITGVDFTHLGDGEVETASEAMLPNLVWTPLHSLSPSSVFVWASPVPVSPVVSPPDIGSPVTASPVSIWGWAPPMPQTPAVDAHPAAFTTPVQDRDDVIPSVDDVAEGPSGRHYPLTFSPLVAGHNATSEGPEGSESSEDMEQA